MIWKTLNELLNKPTKNIKQSKSFVKNCSSGVTEDPNKISNKFNLEKSLPDNSQKDISQKFHFQCV